MHQVGFGFFGRPIGLTYVSNGLLRELNIEEETYLNLPYRVSLIKGEQIVKLSRQTYNQIEVIKIYLYDHAISYNDREGGFIGSAYVFSGNPTKELLYNAVKHLHPKIYSLVDKDHKFISKDFPLKEQDLIAPNTPGLVTGSPRKINPPTDNRDFFVLTDGPLIEHLISAVQGFMYNPNFGNLEHLYVSDNLALLKRLSGNNQNNILGLGHLLNFHNHFQRLNENLEHKKKEYEELNAKIKNRETEALKELEKKTKDLEKTVGDKKRETSELNQQVSNLEIDINERKKKIVNLNGEYVEKQNKKNELKIEVNKLEEKKKELENNNLQNLKKVLNNHKIKPEFEKYVNDHHPKVKELEGEVQKLKTELHENKNSRAPVGQRAVFYSVILILFLSGGYFLGNYFPYGKKIGSNKITKTADDTSSMPEDEPIASPQTFLPREYTVNDFIKLQVDQRKKHKDSLDQFIRNFGKESQENKEAFYNRKWNIGELIDVDKFDQNLVLAGLDRITQIKKLYENQNERIENFDSKFGLMDDNKKFEDENINFHTSKRNEILKIYLEDPRNIYEGIDLDKSKFVVGFDNGDNINDLYKELLVYMHFRWMVYKLSDDQVDLKTTNKTEFKVKILSK